MHIIRDISDGKEPIPIPLTTFETDAQLVRNLEEVFSEYTPVLVDRDEHNHDSDEHRGCSCDPTSSCDMNCECVDSHGHFYDQAGRLQIDALPPLHAMFECSSQCNCSHQACKNRITQRGVQLDLEVRPSQGGHGLGLYTRQDIPRGTFVCIYAGQIIDHDEASRRWKDRGEQSQGNYILVICEATSKATWKTIVDPTHVGNVGRFINHACPPLTSLIILPVRPMGQLTPQPAMFAGRDIAKGEELSFDYAGYSKNLPDTLEVDTSEATGSKALTKCLCGSSRCRGYMPFDPDL